MPAAIDPHWPQSEYPKWSIRFLPHWPHIAGADAGDWQEHWQAFWDRMTRTERANFLQYETDAKAEASRSSALYLSDLTDIDWAKWMTMPEGVRMAVYKWVSDGSGGVVPDDVQSTDNRAYWLPLILFTAAVNGDETDVKRVYRHVGDVATLVNTADDRMKAEHAADLQHAADLAAQKAAQDAAANKPPVHPIGSGNQFTDGGTTTHEPAPVAAKSSSSSWLLLFLAALAMIGGKKK